MPTKREQLVKLISEKINWDDDLSRALDYALDLKHTDKSKPRSIDVVKRVLEMGTDRNTLIATLLSDPELRGILDTKEIEQQFGKKVAILTRMRGPRREKPGWDSSPRLPAAHRRRGSRNLRSATGTRAGERGKTVCPRR